MKIKLIKLEKKHLSDVYNLLYLNISKFKPVKSKFNLIWNKLSKQKNNYFIVVIDNRKLIGFGNLNIVIKVRGSWQGIIEDIVVKKEFQKKGIGKLLVKRLIEIAKKKNCYKVILQSPKKNLYFYKKIGFKERHKSLQKIL